MIQLSLRYLANSVALLSRVISRLRKLKTLPILLRARGSISPRSVALVGVVGPVHCVLAFTLAGLLRPGYSAVHQVISDLGVGHNAWILNADFVLSGLLFIIFAIGFYHWMRPMISKKWLFASTTLLVLSGAGVVNEGFFPEPLPTDPSAHLHRILHNTGFWVIFYALIIALLILGWHLWKTPAWRRYGCYSLITALVTFGLLAFPYQMIGANHIAGLIERVQVVEAFAWSVVMGYRLFTLPPVQHGERKAVTSSIESA